MYQGERKEVVVHEMDGWVLYSPGSSCTWKRFRRGNFVLETIRGEKHQCRVRRRTPDRTRRGAPLWQGGEVGDELSQSRQSDRRRLLLEGWKTAITHSPPRIRVGGVRSRATARTLSIQQCGCAVSAGTRVQRGRQRRSHTSATR